MATHFEDIDVGDTEAVGSVTVTREEIIAFAEQYDPQPFHVDPDAAAASPYGGLVASGWHTVSLTMRLLVEGFLRDAATRGALGVDELRWHSPVRPGDSLTASAEVVSTESWDADTGKVDVRIETHVDDEVVCSMVGLVLFARRTT